MDTLALPAGYLATNLDEWALVAGTVWIGLKAAAVAKAQAAAAAQQAELQAEAIRLQLWEKVHAVPRDMGPAVSRTPFRRRRQRGRGHEAG